MGCRWSEIPETNRRPEAELWNAFEQLRPGFLGALLDALVTGLRQLPHPRLPALPRLADFALWASAADTALGAETGEFIQAYRQNRAEALEAGLDVSPVAGALRIWCAQHVLKAARPRPRRSCLVN